MGGGASANHVVEDQRLADFEAAETLSRMMPSDKTNKSVEQANASNLVSPASNLESNGRPARETVQLLMRSNTEYARIDSDTEDSEFASLMRRDIEVLEVEEAKWDEAERKKDESNGVEGRHIEE